MQHGVDMDTPLLTRDGYPRSDIDVAQSKQPGLWPWKFVLTVRFSSTDNSSAYNTTAKRLQRIDGQHREALARAFREPG